MFDVKCRLSVCCAVLLAGIVMLGGFASSAAAAVTLGIHDGSINACNNSGNWVGVGNVEVGARGQRTGCRAGVAQRGPGSQ